MLINLGKIELTQNQIKHYQRTELWPKYSYIDGEVLVVSSIDVTEEQIVQKRQEFLSLPDTIPQNELEKQSAEEVEALIESKKRELAIEALKKDGKLDNDGKLKK